MLCQHQTFGDAASQDHAHGYAYATPTPHKHIHEHSTHGEWTQAAATKQPVLQSTDDRVGLWLEDAPCSMAHDTPTDSPPTLESPSLPILELSSRLPKHCWQAVIILVSLRRRRDRGNVAGHSWQPVPVRPGLARGSARTQHRYVLPHKVVKVSGWLRPGKGHGSPGSCESARGFAASTFSDDLS